MPRIFAKLKNLFQTKKPILLGLILFFVFLGISVPFHQATAGIFDIGKIAEGTLKLLANVIIGITWQILAGIGHLLLGIASVILTWVTRPGFIGLSYTNPSNNFILDIGWKLTRDLANIGFVVVLIIIGLATALRIKEYQWQKTLPRLIIIILLINFTPVIAGVVVDTSNIIMNYFLKGAVSWDTIDQWSDNWTELKSFKSLVTSFEFLGNAIVLAVFSFTAAAILFVYSALFVMRYVVIWILVILSPLAFFAYILPTTRQYFTMWWKQFIQWCFIGVIAGFFLYLSHQILSGVSKLEISLSHKTIHAGGVIDTILPYFIVVVFLYLSFFVGLKTSAWGAGTIIDWSQKKGKAKLTRAREFTGGAIRGTAPVRKAEKTIRKGLETMPFIGRMVGGPGAYERQKRKKMQEMGKDFEKMDPKEIRRAMKVRPFTYDDKLRQARLFELLVEKGKLSKEDEKYLPMVQRMGLNRDDVLERRPDWAHEKETRKALELKPEETLEKVMAGIDPETFRKNVQEEALSNPKVVLEFMMNESKFREMEEKGKPKLKKAIKKTVLAHNSISPHAPHISNQTFAQKRKRFNRLNVHPRWQV